MKLTHCKLIKSKQNDGEFELDESYFGAKRQHGFYGKLKRGRGTLKQPVFGIFERDVRVSIDGVIYSDGWHGDNGLIDMDYDKHFRVNHGNNEFVSVISMALKAFGILAKEDLLNSMV